MVGSIAVLVGLAWPSCGLLIAAAAAERFGLTWLALDPLALDPLAEDPLAEDPLALDPLALARLAEDCWVADGWLLVAAEKEVVDDAAAGVTCDCLGRWARNGIIA